MSMLDKIIADLSRPHQRLSGDYSKFQKNCMNFKKLARFRQLIRCSRVAVVSGIGLLSILRQSITETICQLHSQEQNSVKYQSKLKLSVITSLPSELMPRRHC